jgi:Ig-like domain from next to BRCA1 gene
MFRIMFFLFALVFFAIILTTCETSSTPTPPALNADAISTQAVSTYVAGQTQSAFISLATALPTFTPTRSISGTPPTITITPTAIPTISLCYKLLYLKDVTIPDNTSMVAGQSFTKTWKVQNNGDCAWAPGFKFTLIGGEDIGGKTFILTKPVPVGEIIELSIEMVAPTGETGDIRGTWRMSDANGAHFGDALTVVISMGGTASTPTNTKSP